jgi:hypothetical protein
VWHSIDMQVLTFILPDGRTCSVPESSDVPLEGFIALPVDRLNFPVLGVTRLKFMVSLAGGD